ncbi:MAG: chemotaxis protein CheW [Pseudomonadota bacterium]
MNLSTNNSTGTAKQISAHTPASDIKKVVVLRFGQFKLILPQADIRTVESIVDVDVQEPADNAAGWINFSGQAWPAYCLSDQLGFIAEVPQSRRACVILALPDGYFGLICDDASVLVNFSVPIFALPSSMHLPSSPLYGVACFEGGFACVSDTTRLAGFVSHISHDRILEEAL